MLCYASFVASTSPVAACICKGQVVNHAVCDAIVAIVPFWLGCGPSATERSYWDKNCIHLDEPEDVDDDEEDDDKEDEHSAKKSPHALCR